jgi:hypothetical protein
MKKKNPKSLPESRYGVETNVESNVLQIYDLNILKYQMNCSNSTMNINYIVVSIHWKTIKIFIIIPTGKNDKFYWKMG